LIACTLQVAAAVVKFGLITICVLVCELIVRFAYLRVQVEEFACRQSPSGGRRSM
jgi:hypothetical protein